MTTDLFDGHAVAGTAMVLGNVGDGLSAAMKLRGVDDDLGLGDVVLVVCEAMVVAVEHKPATKDDFDGPVTKIVKLRGEAATITADKGVQKLLDKHKKQLDERKRLAEEMKGQEALDLEDQALADEEERLAAAEAGA